MSTIKNDLITDEKSSHLSQEIHHLDCSSLPIRFITYQGAMICLFREDIQ